MRSTRTWTAVAAATILILSAGCSRKAVDRGATISAVGDPVGPFRLTLRNRPATPSVGDNRLELALRDKDGVPVRGAKVSLLVSMEAMGAMPRMESRGQGEEGPRGTYEARYSIPMAGDWDVAVRIQHERGNAEATYRLSTTVKEISFRGGTPAGGSPPSPGNMVSEEGGAVTLDPARRQAIGVRTDTVRIRDLSVTIRAAGRVTYDETRRAEVAPKFSGWVRGIRVDYTGRAVRAGEVLFTVYSPELVSAQQEYLTALGVGSSGDSQPADSELAAAARARLLRWDIDAAEIDRIKKAGKPVEEIPVRAPATGVVVEKNIVRGSSFAAGQTLYKIAAIHPVWVIASVYPYELSWARTGMPATILSPFLPEKSRSGSVSYIGPYLDPQARTGQLRVVVPNARGDLKPDMFVDVLLSAPLGKRVAVPESAVLFVGDKRFVFVDLGDGRFAPREVSLGAKSGDWYEVVSGLRAGESVVTSGNFLIASESRLKTAAWK